LEANWRGHSIRVPQPESSAERLAQPFITENRPGAGSNIAKEASCARPLNGYTLLVFRPEPAIHTTFYGKLNYDFLRDIAPVAGILRAPQVMEVHPSVPVRTVSEFIAYAKANPGKINMASAGLALSALPPSRPSHRHRQNDQGTQYAETERRGH
jgi:tripartite-type tricarboxylate transporter receptor subunit TctC